MKEKFSERIPDETEFTVPFARIIYRSSYTRNINGSEDALTKIARQCGMPAEIVLNSLTVEHILPQSVGEETDDEFDVGAIGNLIFVGEELNGKLANKAFKDKAPFFTKANLVYCDPYLAGKTSGSKRISRAGA